MKRALFIFRRDLRLEDNLGLFAALDSADEVILAFIFTPEQIEHNPYRSDSCLQFMIESLEELEEEIAKRNGKLYLFYGESDKVVLECIQKLGVEGVFINRDYTPYSLARDQKIETVCKKHSVSFEAVHDLLLHPIEDTLKKEGSPYTVFTPFYKNALKLPVSKPEPNRERHYYSKPIPFAKDRAILHTILPQRRAQLPGGRKAALDILAHFKSPLSPHLKFTTCSVREAYYAMKPEGIRSLYWREFFTLIALHFPHVFKGPFKPQFNPITWRKDKFHLWTDGMTGFPIVDAGMRELNATGFIHNRIRMVVASFLIKDLHINWQWGEKYFATKLIDYDPALNNGNWQWVAGSGCDAAPYFRVFNPWIQAKKFDPHCDYIKKWVPELATLPPEVIHNWHLGKRTGIHYPAPIVDHAVEAKRIYGDTDPSSAQSLS